MKKISNNETSETHEKKDEYISLDKLLQKYYHLLYNDTFVRQIISDG